MKIIPLNLVYKSLDKVSDNIQEIKAWPPGFHVELCTMMKRLQIIIK
jgi:hypothetical protein